MAPNDEVPGDWYQVKSGNENAARARMDSAIGRDIQ